MLGLWRSCLYCVNYIIICKMLTYIFTIFILYCYKMSTGRKRNLKSKNNQSHRFRRYYAKRRRKDDIHKAINCKLINK